MRQIKEHFDRGSSVRIVGDGTDLTIGIEGRGGRRLAGFRNMPDGEVFYSPLEDSAEGVITYAEFPAVYSATTSSGRGSVFRERRGRRGERRRGRGVPEAGARDRRRRAPPRRARPRLQSEDHPLHAQRPLRREDRRHRPPRRRRELHLHGREERERRALGHGQDLRPRRRAQRWTARSCSATAVGSSDDEPAASSPPRARRRRSRP